MTLIDRPWLLSELSDVYVAKISTPLKVRGVDTSKHETSEYVTIPIYLPGTDKNSSPILMYFRKELHIINSLRAKMIIGNNIIGPEGIIINLAHQKATIGSCDATISIISK